MYGHAGAAEGWHFLTGNEDQIKKLADAVGFRYAYDPDSKQFAHASAIIVLTPDGKISKYFYGIQYSPRDLRLGLVEASAGRIGTPVDSILLFCYHYDPHTGKYGLLISRLIQTGGLLTIAAIGITMLVLFRRERYALPSYKS
jgi:protein SCO1